MPPSPWPPPTGDPAPTRWSWWEGVFTFFAWALASGLVTLAVIGGVTLWRHYFS